MMKKITNKQLLSFIIVLIGILSLFGGTSYAILRGSTSSANEQVIKTGSIKLKLTENFENIDKKIMAMSDSDGLLLSDFYEFNIKNIGDSAAKYDLKLVNEVPSDFTGNLLSSEYIRIGLEINGEEYGPMGLSDVNNIIDENIIYPNEIIRYKLRIWLDDSQVDQLATMSDYKSFFKLGVEAEQRLDKPNAPVLSDNMIPVYYDEDAEVWKKADSANENPLYRWYNYNSKMWANSVTVSSTKRSTYKNAKAGTEIPMDDILTMQVWIPRYKYKVWNYNADGTVTSSPQEIEIMFESGTETTGEITCSDSISGTNGAASETCTLKSTNATCTDSTCNNKTYTHTAFTFGTQELEGIWVGKFEISAPTDSTCYTSVSEDNCNKTGITPLVKPDVKSYRRAQGGTFESNMMAMNDSDNIYGFAYTDDTHMMKNMEWGAVAYLSHSKYGTCTGGTCTEININNSESYYTGRSGGSTSALETAVGTYKYNEIGTAGADGPSASTTGNIYGIYDISGGAFEYVMGNIVYSDGTTMMSGYTTSQNSGYTGIIYDSGNYTSYTETYSYPENKYLDKYSFGTSNTQKKRSKLGDAVKEVTATSSTGWYSDYGYVASASDPGFVRGGHYADGASAGVVDSSGSRGAAYSSCSARVVVLAP